jgi:very-short-patch-repair endonuclease
MAKKEWRGGTGGLTRARGLRSNSTDAEARLWSRLRNNQLGGHKFRRQAPIGPYVVDFLCAIGWLVVEVDGGQHARNRQRDERRDAWLRDRGYRTLRFWNNQVLGETDAVLEEILRTLQEQTPDDA